MMRRRRKSKNPAAEEESYQQEQDEEFVRKLEKTEDRFRKLLNPAESYVMGIQSVLVWENITYSAVVFTVVNILFWLATRLRFYHLLGLIGLLVVFTDMWTSKIWPEIRAPPSPSTDNEDWTPVHPRLLSVPEISSLVAYYWVRVFAFIDWVVHLRKTSHFKFFVLMVFILVGIGMLGSYISGIMLSYLIVMGTFTIPAIIYHNILPQVFEIIQPFILKIDTTFNVKRAKTKKGKRKGREHAREPADDSDSSDADIREFVPTPVPKIVRPQEDDSVIENAGLLTPDSFPASREVSDYDSNDDDFSFARGLRSMPGIDDTQHDDSHSETGSRLEVPDMELEGTDVSEGEQDITLPADDPDKDYEEKKAEPMKFVSSHFKEPTPTESDDETTGLKFPDFREVDEPEQPAEVAGGLLAAVASQLPASVTADIMSKTVSNLMSSTVAGLSKIGQSMSTQGQEQEPPPRGPRRPMTESAESDIMAEFEFLDEEDLDLDTQPSSGPK